MELRAFLASLPDDAARRAFAVDCGTSLGHLRNAISNPRKRLAPAVCVQIEQRSARQVRRQTLRPADWHLIWPELMGSEAALIVGPIHHPVMCKGGEGQRHAA